MRPNHSFEARANGKPPGPDTRTALVLIRVKQIKWCGLTIRLTGPIAAGWHLGYKSLAQIPAHHNRPVSSNVRRPNRHVHTSYTAPPLYRATLASGIFASTRNHPSPTVNMGRQERQASHGCVQASQGTNNVSGFVFLPMPRNISSLESIRSRNVRSLY